MKLRFPKLSGKNARYYGVGLAVLIAVGWVMFAPKFVRQKEINQAQSMIPFSPSMSSLQPTSPFGLLPFDKTASTIYSPISHQSAFRGGRILNNMIGISSFRGRVSLG